MTQRGEFHRRKALSRRTNKRILIFCEGAKTEPIYFNAIKNKYNIIGLDIKIPKTDEKHPLRLVEAAIQKIIKDEDLDLNGDDQVWCVYDVDESTESVLNEASKKADKQKIKIALSNPSFELWYLLHYEYTTSQMTNPQLVQRLKQHINDYEKNKSILDRLESDSDASREEAIKRANKLIDYHKKIGRTPYSLDCNPSTQVFELVDYIFNHIAK